MNVLTMILIFSIMFFVLIGGAITVFAIIGLKKRTVAKIILPNNKLFSHKIKDISETFKFKEHTYVYDADAEIKTFWGTHVYYYYNNPNPIIFDNNNEDNIAKVRSKDLKTLFESNLIEKLFKTDDYQFIIMILVIGAIIATFAVGFLVLSGNSKPVELSMQGNNTMIIKDACRMALMGV